MDTFLAITSKRDTRRYGDRPIPADVQNRIFEAGRLAGSARNRQPWRFVVVESAARRAQLAEAVYEPTNVLGAQLVVAIVGSSGLDGGRCLQNMMLAAWNDGVGSCPNGFRDEEAARGLLDARPDQELLIGISFGYPASLRRPERRPAEAWLARARRLPLEEVVQAWL